MAVRREPVPAAAEQLHDSIACFAGNSLIKPELLDRMVQLHAPAPDPWVIAALHLDPRIGSDLLARLVDPLPAAFAPRIHEARHHQRLRAGAAFRFAAFHEQLVDAYLTRLALGHAARDRGAGPDLLSPVCLKEPK